MQELAHKTAVVTGAASGIGLALTEGFVARDMNVVMADVEDVTRGIFLKSLAGPQVEGLDAVVHLGRVLCPVAVTPHAAEFRLRVDVGPYDFVDDEYVGRRAVAPAPVGVFPHLPAVLRIEGEETAVFAGDRIQRVEKRQINVPRDIDAELENVHSGDSVDVHILRDGQRQTISLQPVVQRSAYGTILRGRPRGETGFAAPEWFGYAWFNLNDAPPPSRESTAGKIVIVHAFQSW